MVTCDWRPGRTPMHMQRLGGFWSRVVFLVVLFWGNGTEPQTEATLCSAARLYGLDPSSAMVLLVPWIAMAGVLLLVHALRGVIDLLAFACTRLAARRIAIVSLPPAHRCAPVVALVGDMPWDIRAVTMRRAPPAPLGRRGRGDEWDLRALAIHATCATVLGAATSTRVAWPCSVHSLLFASPAWAAPLAVTALLFVGGGDDARNGTILALMWPEIVERFAVEGIYWVSVAVQ